ncbi:ATP-dependent nuclease [Paenibacillus rhizophilus]|uniref:ATP-binding protein n=1 Tax=Paenibacillus rhizophilus TaxID=1850366 RepID=A0A3N9PF68_9BACL|nr:ATP-binding protein [Paenibacillus rhizophilus]RQW13684.1 hypothetical protein EH198_04600 [Paenibacillus rhizophilus]
MIESLFILGLRGFSKQQRIDFAIPNGNNGSGLTLLVGANNSGKSTIIEAIRAISPQPALPSFTQGRRNVKSGDAVSICITDHQGKSTELRSVNAGSSESHMNVDEAERNNIFVLPSRRAFNPFFHKHEMDRYSYMVNFIGFPPQRTNSQDNFGSRLFGAEKNKKKFNEVLGRVLNPVPNWAIDQHDTGNYFLKIMKDSASHSSEGLGEGIVSLFFIVDALYESKPNDVIVIDEPELSLHPSVQKRLSKLLNEYAKDRQIVISTHSPYFIELENLKWGATVARVHQTDDGCIISQISKKSNDFITRVLRNSFNPHVFGINAKEIFFLEESVVLVEGQDDVIFYNKILNEIDVKLEASFLGWGIGGADNIRYFANLLSELGFKKVVGILDLDRQHMIESLNEEFPQYKFYNIKANDVRTKDERKATEKVIGLLDDKNKVLRHEHLESTKELFSKVKEYFN